RVLTFTTAGRVALASSTQIAKGASRGPSPRASVQKPATAREKPGGWRSIRIETTPPTTKRTATTTSATSQTSRWVTRPFYQWRAVATPGSPDAGARSGAAWPPVADAWQNGRIPHLEENAHGL